MGSRLWGAMVAFGCASVVLGLLMVTLPGVTLFLAAVLFGVQLIAYGVYRLVHGFGRTRPASRASGWHRAVDIVLGVAAVIIGLLCLVNVLATLTVLAVVLGIFWIVTGVSHIAEATHRGLTGGERALMTVLGVLSVFAGLIVLAWPSETLFILAMVLGIWVIVLGVMAIVNGIRLRRLAQAM